MRLRTQLRRLPDDVGTGCSHEFCQFWESFFRLGAR
jgi:hypothetical protein